MYTRQCKGCQMSQCHNVLLKEMTAMEESFNEGFTVQWNLLSTYVPQW